MSHAILCVVEAHRAVLRGVGCALCFCHSGNLRIFVVSGFVRAVLDGDLGAMFGVALFVLRVVSASKAADHLFDVFLFGEQFGLSLLIGLVKCFSATAKCPRFLMEALKFFADLCVVFVDIDDAADQAALEAEFLDLVGHQVAVLCGISVDMLVLFGERLVDAFEALVLNACRRWFREVAFFFGVGFVGVCLREGCEQAEE